MVGNWGAAELGRLAPCPQSSAHDLGWAGWSHPRTLRQTDQPSSLPWQLEVLVPQGLWATVSLPSFSRGRLHRAGTSQCNFLHQSKTEKSQREYSRAVVSTSLLLCLVFGSKSLGPAHAAGERITHGSASRWEPCKKWCISHCSCVFTAQIYMLELNFGSLEIGRELLGSELT